MASRCGHGPWGDRGSDRYQHPPPLPRRPSLAPPSSRAAHSPLNPHTPRCPHCLHDSGARSSIARRPRTDCRLPSPLSILHPPTLHLPHQWPSSSRENSLSGAARHLSTLLLPPASTVTHAALSTATTATPSSVSLLPASLLASPLFSLLLAAVSVEQQHEAVEQQQSLDEGLLDLARRRWVHPPRAAEAGSASALLWTDAECCRSRSQWQWSCERPCASDSAVHVGRVRRHPRRTAAARLTLDGGCGLVAAVPGGGCYTPTASQLADRVRASAANVTPTAVIPRPGSSALQSPHCNVSLSLSFSVRRRWRRRLLRELCVGEVCAEPPHVRDTQPAAAAAALDACDRPQTTNQ